jgi:hypothetical protein
MTGKGAWRNDDVGWLRDASTTCWPRWMGRGCWGWCSPAAASGRKRSRCWRKDRAWLTLSPLPMPKRGLDTSTESWIAGGASRLGLGSDSRKRWRSSNGWAHDTTSSRPSGCCDNSPDGIESGRVADLTGRMALSISPATRPLSADLNVQTLAISVMVTELCRRHRRGATTAGVPLRLPP